MEEASLMGLWLHYSRLNTTAYYGAALPHPSVILFAAAIHCSSQNMQRLPNAK